MGTRIQRRDRRNMTTFAHEYLPTARRPFDAAAAAKFSWTERLGVARATGRRFDKITDDDLELRAAVGSTRRRLDFSSINPTERRRFGKRAALIRAAREARYAAGETA